MLGDDLRAVDALEHQHALGHVGPDHLRHDEVVVVGDRAGDQLGVCRLLDEVELAPEVPLELLRECAELEQAGRARALLEEDDRRADHVQVELDLVGDAGAAHLDHHVAAVGEKRPVDLRDRSGRQRLGLELREGVVAQVLPDDPLDVLERKRRHLVDELAELLHVDVRKQVRTGREQLPELEVRRPELLEGEPELDGAFARRRPLPDDSDLAQGPQEAPATRDAGDLERAWRAGFVRPRLVLLPRRGIRETWEGPRGAAAERPRSARPPTPSLRTRP